LPKEASSEKVITNPSHAQFTFGRDCLPPLTAAASGKDEVKTKAKEHLVYEVWLKSIV